MDTLKRGLQFATDDTTRLRIYIALGNLCEKKDNLLYALPALDIADKLLSTNITGKEREAILSQEIAASYLVIPYYTGKDSVNWRPVNKFFEDKAQKIEQTGNYQRIGETATFLAGMYAYKNDTTLYLQKINKALLAFIQAHDTASVVKLYNGLFNFYKMTGSYSRALESIRAAIDMAGQPGFEKALATSHSMLADLYRDNGENNRALENYNTALAVLQKAKDTNDMFNLIASIGGFYYSQHNSSKAIDYYNRLFRLAGPNNDAGHNVGYIYKWKGIVYKDDQLYEQALIDLKKSALAFDSSADRDQQKLALDEIGIVFYQQEKMDSAIRYHMQAIQMSDSIQWEVGSAVSSYLLARDYFQGKDYQEAKVNVGRALTTLNNQLDIKPLSNAELLAAQIDSALGNGNAAFVHYKKYVSLNDRLKTDEIKRHAQQENFQDELDNQKAEQLRKDDATRRIRNQQYLIIISLGILVLAILAIAIIQYRNNKQKQQANALLKVQKEKIEATLAELKSAQAQLIQSEKMASLGQLTAGIAHEIQNPLNFVNNFSEVNREMLEELKAERLKPNPDKTLEDEIINDITANNDKINHHGGRADAIVKGMLQHSRTAKGIKEPTDINTLCDEYFKLSYAGFRSKDSLFNATVKTDFDNSINKINVVPQDIGRVLLNLYNNAFYAVNEKRIQRKVQDEKYEAIVSVNTKKQSNNITITISDNGNGIPQNIVDKIFQPFFTTKPTGQGTGLGLSLAYDIVKAHGGAINVASQEGEGSEFIVQIPVSV